MSQAYSTDVARILMSPWQQHLNASGWRGVALVAGFCALFPVGLPLASLFAGPVGAQRLRDAAWLSSGLAALALLLAGWAMLVANVLQQNRPVLARLVPRQVGRLRAALLLAWALLSAAMAAGPGFVFGAPLAWGCATAAALLAIACCVCWPVLGVAAIAVPFMAAGLAESTGRDASLDVLGQAWRRLDGPIALALAIGGAAALSALVRSGGTERAASGLASWRMRRERSSLACGQGGRLASRLYARLLRRTLARGGAVMSRVLLGLGPALHWTSRVGNLLTTLLVCIAMFGAFLLLLAPGQRPLIVPWAAFAALTSLGNASLQAMAQLRRTRREQALLALLPGVPRGAALNRWLAWRLTLPHLATTGVALLLWAGIQAIAEAMQPGSVQRAMGPTGILFALSLPPLVVLCWRDWSRSRDAPALDSSLPALMQVALVALAFALHALSGLGYPAIAVGYAVAALAWCTWRWRCMGAEPSALPVGRLA